MKKSFSSLNDSRVFWLFFLIVIITRLPFLNSGNYGMDFDAWLVADAAEQIGSNYKYVASRLPGYPVQEIIYSIIPYKNPLIFSLVTAIISSLGIAFFGLILKKFQSKMFIYGTIALAMTPVYYINSVNSMDYLWALSSIIAGFYYLSEKKYILSGILIGIAVGCRITSGAALLPFLYYIYYNEGFDFKKFLKLIIPTLTVSFLVFVPVLYEYGLGFFMFYDEAYPNILEIIKKASYFIWGIIGFIFLIPVLLSTLLNILKAKINFNFPNLFFIIYFILFLYAFFRFPKEPEYLLPVIPFFIIFLAKYLNMKLFKLFSISLIFASFLVSVRFGSFEVNTIFHKNFSIGSKQVDIALDGPVFINYKRKSLEIKYLHNVVDKLNTMKSKSIVIAGWNKNKLNVLYKTGNQNVKLVIYPDKEEIIKYIDDGYQIYYLSKAYHTEQLYSEIKSKMKILK